MIKQIALPIAVIAIAAGTTLGATGAFFSDSETSAANTFSAGTLNLMLNDWDGTTATTHAPFSISGMMPGQEVSKLVKVESTGDAWLKLSVTNIVATDSVVSGAINGGATPNGDIDTELLFDAILVAADGTTVIGTLASNQTLAQLSAAAIYITPAVTANTPMYVKVVAKLPGTTLNGAQGDSVVFDVKLDAKQYVNNESQATGW